jgi:hypothetical protein
VFLSTTSALKLRPFGAFLRVMLSITVSTCLCLATDRRDVAVSLALEALRESRLWAVVLGEVKSRVANQAALDDPVSRLPRRNTYYKRGMSLARGVPAIELGDSREAKTIVEGWVFLL